MKKDLRLMILATLGALAVLLGAPLYQRYKVAGEEIVRVEIYYIPRDPKSAGSGGNVLKYQVSGEKAKSISQQWQLDPNYQSFGTPYDWMSDFHQIIIIRRNGQRLGGYFHVPSGFANAPFQDGKTLSWVEQRLTPQSLRYFRTLLAPKNSASKATKKPPKP